MHEQDSGIRSKWMEWRRILSRTKVSRWKVGGFLDNDGNECGRTRRGVIMGGRMVEVMN